MAEVEISLIKKMLYTKEQNLAAFKKLPTAVREFFMSEDTVNDISEVVRANSLSPEQRSMLLDITNEFILGFTTAEECERNLVQSLSLSGERAENVKKYLKNKVVDKVKFLKTLPDEEASEEERGAEQTEKVDTKPSVSVEKGVVSDTISNISKKYQLTVEQEAGVEKEVNKILSGEGKLAALRSNIVSLYKITYDQALKIAYDLNERVFSQTKNEPSPKGLATEKTNQEAMFKKQAPQPQPSPKNISPDHMIPDHQAMEITDGPHLHSQNIMPQSSRDQGRGNNFGTIIDQKLSRIVKNTAEPAEVSKSRSERYKGNDPYREPIS